MKVRNKKCRICRQEFIPKYSTMQATCENIECMLTYSSKQKDKKIKRELKETRGMATLNRVCERGTRCMSRA